jgi:membrane associated rhomboid family serine protease
MGIYDRDYYRREGHSIFGSFSDRGVICKWLIVINIVVFVLQLLTRRWGVADPTDPDLMGMPAGGPVTEWFVLNVDRVLHGEVWRLLTYAFLHDPRDIFHILFNMLLLWWFGTDVEDLYGTREFLACYLVSAFVGGLIFVLTFLTGLSRGSDVLGASGAVMAVMVLCALHYPDRRILLFWLIPVPIWLCILLWVARDAFIFLSSVDTGIAVSVHLAGAGFAYAYYKRNWRLLDLWATVASWWQRRRRPRLRVYPDDEPTTPVAVPGPSSRDVDEHLEAKVDAVLEKVSRHGQDSLTDSEREILFRASEVYKKKRT